MTKFMDAERFGKLEALIETSEELSEDEIAERKLQSEQKPDLFHADTNSKGIFAGLKNIVVLLDNVKENYPYLVLSGRLKNSRLALHDLENVRPIEIQEPEGEIQND